MTIATLRPDGWPQATTVGYANDGFTLYFLCAPDSQKAANLARDDRVSLTIDHDTPQVMEISGLSMAARAQAVTDAREGEQAMRMLMERYPQQQSLPFTSLPSFAEVRLFRLTPRVISVLDYSRGFGHTELVTCQADSPGRQGHQLVIANAGDRPPIPGSAKFRPRSSPAGSSWPGAASPSSQASPGRARTVLRIMSPGPASAP